MSETAASTRRKLSEVLKVLEKAYGKVHVLPKEPPLDHAIYLILRENWDYRKAVRALHVLQREFVDWNEVRVTTAGELRDNLAELGDREVDVKIEKVRTLLDVLYRERNCAHLNFLIEMDADEQQRFLEMMGVLTSAQVAILLRALAGEEPRAVPQQAVRVLSRIGLIPRVTSPNAAKKQVAAIAEGEDEYSFEAHLVHHGDEVCLSKSPRCGECAVLSLCGFHRKVGVS